VQGGRWSRGGRVRALLWTTGHRSVGRRALAAGLGWFLLAALVLIPLANGRASPHLELNYGITGSGPTILLEAVPTLAENIWRDVADGRGDTYLLLIFAPLLGLPLVDPRWLLPVMPPILLNLAAIDCYQQEIRYQYLATAAPSWPWRPSPACGPWSAAGWSWPACWSPWWPWPASSTIEWGQRHGPRSFPARPGMGRSIRPAVRRCASSTLPRPSAPTTTWSPTSPTAPISISSPTRFRRPTGASR
jgi:hypothetical protein